MPKIRPQILAIRAINQYRKRDILPYLGLRYYLHNECARRDRWSADVATHLVLTRNEYKYYNALHFKEVRENSSILHRSISIPGPNEALAEAALLAECAKYPEVFGNLPSTYSYDLANDNYTNGMFKTYFPGFRQRHHDVVDVCKQNKNDIVLYTDIRRFYPNIEHSLAVNTWKDACNKAEISSKYREIGLKLLHDHFEYAKSTDDGKGILTGPMFSHLVGNMVLRKIDEHMAENMPNRYFRYVDDIILTGSRSTVSSARKQLANLLMDMGLQLHDGDKDFKVTAKTWLTGERDFDEDTNDPNWPSFIGDLKRFLIFKPELKKELEDRFRDEQFRIPLLDYLSVIDERDYINRLKELLQWKWLRKKTHRLSVDSILEQGRVLRERYARELYIYLADIEEAEHYERKRKIPKIRFLAGRLVYIGEEALLVDLMPKLLSINETYLLGNIYKAILSNDVTKLLSLGINAVQSAAQILRGYNDEVKYNPEKPEEVDKQGLAILSFNGVSVNNTNVDSNYDEINQLANLTGNLSRLVNSECDFIKEMICLHGTHEEGRHEEMLSTAFDADEELAFDVLSQQQQSDYCQ